MNTVTRISPGPTGIAAVYSINFDPSLNLTHPELVAAANGSIFIQTNDGVCNADCKALIWQKDCSPSCGPIVLHNIDSTEPLLLDYRTAGTSSYTIPVGYRFMSLVVAGGGGGGGSGRRGAAGSNRYGGGGGEGGGYASAEFLVSEIGGAGSVLTITRGAGGAGGAAVTADSTDGNAGADGQPSVVSSSLLVTNTGLAYIFGGKGGNGGGSTAGAGGHTTVRLGVEQQGIGADSSVAATPTVAVYTPVAGGGGGAGGGIDSSDVERAGGPAGAGGTVTSGLLAAPGSPIAGGTVPGGNGTSQTINVTRGARAGSAGSGGAASKTTAAGTGGNGASGAGGAGGGASLNGFNSGAGGAGGAGFVRIIFHN